MRARTRSRCDAASDVLASPPPVPLAPPSTVSTSDFSRLDSASAPYFAQWADSAASGAGAPRVEAVLFNVSNADAVLVGADAALAPVGPFLLDQNHLMHDVAWENGGDVIRFERWRWFEAAAAGAAAADGGAGAPLSTLVTSLYVPLIVLIAHGYGGISAQAGAGLGVGVGSSASAGVSAGVGASAAGNSRSAGSAAGGLAGDARPRLSRLRRILAGACDGSEGAELQLERRVRLLKTLERGDVAAAEGGADAAPLVLDTTGCRLPAAAAAAAARLRAAVALVDASRDVGGGGAAPAALFVTRPASDFLFGYADPIFEALNELDDSFPDAYPGLLRNTSSLADSQAEGNVVRMFTGLSTPLGSTLITWDDMDSLLCCEAGPCGSAGPRGSDSHAAWASADANDVDGSLGWAFSGGLSAQSDLSLFEEEATRRIRLAPVPDGGGAAAGATYGGGAVPTLRFAFEATQFLSQANAPQNADYFAPASLDGLLNDSSCALGGAPVFFSMPYFLGGNASLPESVGLPPPQPALHASWFDVEPLTGKVLASRRRLQTNLFVDQLQVPLGAGAPPGLGRSLFPLVKPVFLPLLWTDESLLSSDAWTRSFADEVLSKYQEAHALEVGGAIAASLLGAAALALAARGYYQRRATEAAAWDSAVLLVSSGDAEAARAFEEEILSGGGEDEAM